MSNSTNGNSQSPVIEVDDVVHSFKGRRALDHVSFKVMPQSLHGFVGPNGAGKTTSLKIICTLLRPQFGVVKVFGHDVIDEQKLVRQKIGFMPDHFSTYRQMTVYEYLDFFAAAYGLAYSERTRVIDEVLALTDMDGRKNDLISGLSRGMQQRTSLARVLVNDPELLLLDEPASGLDPRARIELMDILKALRSMGKTIFISSHILPELAELCDSVTIIDKGKLMYTGSMSGLQASTNEHPTWRVTFEAEVDGLVDRINTLNGVVHADQVEGRPEYRIAYDSGVTDTNRLLRNLLDFDLPIVGFAEDKRHLNDAFMDLTTKGVK